MILGDEDGSINNINKNIYNYLDIFIYCLYLFLKLFIYLFIVDFIISIYFIKFI